MSTQKNNKTTDKKNASIAQKEILKKKKLLSKSVPLYVFILIFIPICSVGFYFYTPHNMFGSANPEISKQSIGMNDAVDIGREIDTGLVHPLLYVDAQDEKMLNPTKTKLNSYLEQKVFYQL